MAWKIQSAGWTVWPRKPTTSRLATFRRRAFSSSFPPVAADAPFRPVGVGDAAALSREPHPAAAAVTAKPAPARRWRRFSLVAIALNYPKLSRKVGDLRQQRRAVSGRRTQRRSGASRPWSSGGSLGRFGFSGCGFDLGPCLGGIRG